LLGEVECIAAMTNRTLAFMVGLVLLIVPCLTVPLRTLAAINGTCTPAPAVISTGGTPTMQWDTEQVANARAITTVAADKQMPARGTVIALAAAMQESGLRNLADGDRDSIGLFQQRPSQGWGTPTQLRDPTFAAGVFYDKLATIPGWQTMPFDGRARTSGSANSDPCATTHGHCRWQRMVHCPGASAGLL
jgi:hypothetical protein